MVASYVGESGQYADFGEFLSNWQMFVNQFNTRLPAILANLAISANVANAANSCQRGLLFNETNYLSLKQQGTTSQ